jgi:hypothetical protein
VLAVTFTELKGTRSGKVNLLSWKTASEGTAIRFDVERSTDGANFSGIGAVAATGDNSTYTFADDQFTAATNYYRLRITDADGKVGYSKTIVLKEDGNSITLATVRPNPFMSEVTVSVSLNAAIPVTLSLVDMWGRTVAQKQVRGVKGFNTVKLTGLTTVSKGLYILQLAADGVVLQEKLVK